MARQQAQGRPGNEIGFRDIELLKEENLGVGSCGSVCKARCDSLVCAAKIIHPTLATPEAFQQFSRQREHRHPFRRFEMECDFLKDIKHPNIVQCLGIYCDPETGLPVLLMELMDESLTHFLERSTKPIPYHIQLTICQDIVQALSFLHLNGIIHRDLSSNNILLIGKDRAKLTDFGMAKLVNTLGISNTECPGTNVYMPPEAFGSKAVYTVKGDTFSFGVNIVQILTRKFPSPGDRHVSINDPYFEHPQFPTGRVEIRITEIERRKNHISEINPAHPLLMIAHDCLKDQEGERPSAGELCHRLAALKNTQEYTESERAVKCRETLLMQNIHEKNCQLAAKEEHIEQLQITIAEKDQLIEAKDMLLNIKEQALVDRQREIEDVQQSQRARTGRQIETQDLREELSTTQATVREKEQTIVTPPTQPTSLRGHQPAQHPSSIGSGEGVIRLNWTPGRKAPCKMYGFTDAVVDGSVAYFNPAETREIYSYSSTTDTWSRLPDCRTERSMLAIVNGLLTTVGGVYNGNKLFSLTGEGRDRKWTEVLPPIPTKRSQATAVTTGRALIVAGGIGNEQSLKTVEIMNIDTRQWSRATGLPQGACSTSATVCGDRIYMTIGESVIMCFLPALLQSCRPKIFETQPSTALPQGPVWSTVTALPVKQSTLASTNNRLLAVGGLDSYLKPTTSVYLYDAINNSWQAISHLSSARSSCFTVVLPNSRVMIAGGFTFRSLSSASDTVEFADVVVV